MDKQLELKLLEALRRTSPGVGKDNCAEHQTHGQCCDFVYHGNRYKVSAWPSAGDGEGLIQHPGLFGWDYLIWLRYSADFKISEAWQWDSNQFRIVLDERASLAPDDMRRGERLL